MMGRSSNDQKSDAHQRQSHQNSEIRSNQANHDRQVAANKSK